MCNHWTVVSPEICYVDVILDDGTGPLECGKDVVFVEAETKRKALVAGLRAMRERKSATRARYGYFMHPEDDSVNPFTGMAAERAQCKHGFCWAEDLEIPCPDHFEEDLCPDCELEWKQACQHDWYTGLVARDNNPAKEEEHCINCMTSKEEFNSW